MHFLQVPPCLRETPPICFFEKYNYSLSTFLKTFLLLHCMFSIYYVFYLFLLFSFLLVGTDFLYFFSLILVWNLDLLFLFF